MGNLSAAIGGNSDEIEKSILENSTGDSKLFLAASVKDQFTSIDKPNERMLMLNTYEQSDLFSYISVRRHSIPN